MALIKRLEEITRKDFEMSPYWMLCSGKIDEFDPDITLIPQEHPDYDSNSVRLIRTEYILNTGLALDGFLYENPPEFNRHTIFIKDTGFETFFGIFPPSLESMSFIYDMLGLKGQDVFPILWESFGKEYSGFIDGFTYTENGVNVIVT